MGRASSSKKVSRAARAAGKPGTSRNLLWPAVITALVALGVALIVVSIPEDRVSAAPRIGDHWHAAYGIYLCGEFEEPLFDGPEGDVSGVHSHGDGLIHMHPFSSRVTGTGANLGAFGETVEYELTDDSLTLPGRETLNNGDDCGGSPGVVQVKVWTGLDDAEGRLIESDLADYAPQDGELVTIAFLPEGEDIPQPPSAGTTPSDLDVNPTEPGSDVSTSTTSIPEGTTDTSEAPPDASTTTVAPDSTATTVPPE